MSASHWSTAFKGAEVTLRSHVVVFANCGPPEYFSKRCVWLLEPRSLGDQPAWQYPYLQPGQAAAAAAIAAASAAVPLPEDAPAVAPVGVAAPAGGGCALMQRPLHAISLFGSQLVYGHFSPTKLFGFLSHVASRLAS